VGYLGPGVSAALQDASPGMARSAGRPIRSGRPARLPQLADAAQLAQAMGITVAELRFPRLSPRGGPHPPLPLVHPAQEDRRRAVDSAPMPRLKRAQYRWTTSSPRCPRTVPPTASWPAAPS
jgi:hypothetical protein